jgi:hypothetical protein
MGVQNQPAVRQRGDIASHGSVRGAEFSGKIANRDRAAGAHKIEQELSTLSTKHVPPPSTGCAHASALLDHWRLKFISTRAKKPTVCHHTDQIVSMVAHVVRHFGKIVIATE